jgi:hypothetical protein
VGIVCGFNNRVRVFSVFEKGGDVNTKPTVTADLFAAPEGT